MVPNDCDGYDKADASDSDVCGTCSRDTLILGTGEAGTCTVKLLMLVQDTVGLIQVMLQNIILETASNLRSASTCISLANTGFQG